MAHTVALLAPNGDVGSQTLQYLVEAHKQGDINLVVLHRPGGPPKSLPTEAKVDVREIQLDGPLAQIKAAVRDVNVLM